MAASPDAGASPVTFPGCTQPDEMGAPLAQLGRVDRSPTEFALAPDGYAGYQAAFPDDVDADGTDPAAWSYVLPGPSDAWAGSRAHTFRLRFDLDAVPSGGLRFVAWLVDTAAIGPSSAFVSLNDGPAHSTAVPRGAGGGLTATGPRAQTAIDVDLPAAELRAGENVVALTRSTGSWLAFDSVGVFRPRTARTCRRAIVRGHIGPEQVYSFVYAPVDVPAGTTELSVRQDYSDRGPNAIDLGAFDPDGYALGTQRGFRGWSGGYRSDFTITRSWATPAYLPGPVEPGRWNVVLGPYVIAPQGADYALEVTTRRGDPGPRFRPDPPVAALDRRRGWYRGDLHLHTVHSDGSLLPEDLVAGARARGLDFFVSTDHNTTSSQLIWGRYAPDDLLVIPGEEVTTRGGHWNAIGVRPGHFIDFRYGASAPALLERFVDEVHRDGGIVSANHPSASCGACGWGFPYEPMDVVEVWNGPWDTEDERSLAGWDARLRAGDRQPAEGASDAHRLPNVIGLPQTVVRARALATAAIVRAIAAGRSYIARDPSISLRLTARAGRRSAGIGEQLRTGRRTVTVGLEADGVDGARATLIGDEGPIASTPIAGDRAQLRWTVPDTRWIRAEIRDAGGAMLALTNPIYLQRAHHDR